MKRSHHYNPRGTRSYRRHYSSGDVIDKTLEWGTYGFVATVIGGLGISLAHDLMNQPPDHYDGVITGKSYDDPDTTHGVMSNGRTTTPYVRHDGPHWNITVKTNDNEDSEYKNYIVEIDKEQYQKLTIGEKVHVDNDIVTPDTIG